MNYTSCVHQLCTKQYKNITQTLLNLDKFLKSIALRTYSPVIIQSLFYNCCFNCVVQSAPLSSIKRYTKMSQSTHLTTDKAGWKLQIFIKSSLSAPALLSSVGCHQ